MNTVQRRHELVQTTLKVGKVQVLDSAEKYGVSSVTIRSDLNLLHRRGLLVRTRGGAFANNRIPQELSIDEKYNKRLEIKQKLAIKACQFIQEEDAIILDSGTTCAEIAKCLQAYEYLLVMTNGLNVAQNLVKTRGIEVLMTGGTLRKKSMSLYGRHAEDSLQRYHFDKVILGVDGFDFEAGITTHFEHEAILNRIMCDVARQVIVVTDSSKFNQSGVHRIRAFGDIDILITDSGIPDTFATSLQNKGVKLVVIDQ